MSGGQGPNSSLRLLPHTRKTFISVCPLYTEGIRMQMWVLQGGLHFGWLDFALDSHGCACCLGFMLDWTFNPRPQLVLWLMDCVIAPLSLVLGRPWGKWISETLTSLLFCRSLEDLSPSLGLAEYIEKSDYALPNRTSIFNSCLLFKGHHCLSRRESITF